MLGPSMSDRNAGGKIVSPSITSSTDLTNLSHVMTLTKYPLAPARNAAIRSFSRLVIGYDRNPSVWMPASEQFYLLDVRRRNHRRYGQ